MEKRRNRLKLHEEICMILGSRHAYFQPPSSILLEYDCCVYKKRDIKAERADNRMYAGFQAYELLFIYRDPDQDYAWQCMQNFQYCKTGQPYTVDNLYHCPVYIYY